MNSESIKQKYEELKSSIKSKYSINDLYFNKILIEVIDIYLHQQKFKMHTKPARKSKFTKQQRDEMGFTTPEKKLAKRRLDNTPSKLNNHLTIRETIKTNDGTLIRFFGEEHVMGTGRELSDMILDDILVKADVKPIPIKTAVLFEDYEPHIEYRLSQRDEDIEGVIKVMNDLVKKQRANELPVGTLLLFTDLRIELNVQFRKMYPQLNINHMNISLGWIYQYRKNEYRNPNINIDSYFSDVLGEHTISLAETKSLYHLTIPQMEKILRDFWRDYLRKDKRQLVGMERRLYEFMKENPDPTSFHFGFWPLEWNIIKEIERIKGEYGNIIVYTGNSKGEYKQGRPPGHIRPVFQAVINMDWVSKVQEK
jgi:hypothetical protein